MSAKNEGSASMRMFGAVVRALREARAVTTKDLADAVGYSQSLIIKVERGERMPPPDFIPRAEPLIGGGEVMQRAAAHLERGEFPSWFEPYADLERSAVSLYTFDTLAINGLLQVEKYAWALLETRCPALEPEEIERRVQARMARQTLLTRTPLAQLAFLVEESVLRRPVGGPEVHREQLERLLETGALRNVTLQVLPMDYGAHPGYDGPMHLLETPERQLLGYLEVQARSFLVDDRDEVSELHQRYAMIRSQALNARESAKLIKQIAGEL